MYAIVIITRLSLYWFSYQSKPSPQAEEQVTVAQSVGRCLDAAQRSQPAASAPVTPSARYIVDTFILNYELQVSF